MNFNLNEFFYNILPGTFFLLFWIKENTTFYNYFLSAKSIVNNDAVLGITLLIFAFFVGLILHGVQRTIKYYYTLKDEKKNSKFYDQNAYIWAKGYRQLPEFFSSRASVWGSSIVGLALSIFIVGKYWLFYVVAIIIFVKMLKADSDKERKSINRTYLMIKREKEAK